MLKYNLFSICNCYRYSLIVHNYEKKCREINSSYDTQTKYDLKPHARRDPKHNYL